MLSSLLLVTAAFTSLATAQSSANLLVPAGGSNIIAFPITSDATATTYLVGCSTTNSGSNNYCAYAAPYTLTQGPSTANLVLLDSGVYTISVGCQLAGTTSASCSESIGGASAGTAGGVTATVISGDDLKSAFIPVAIATARNQVVDQSAQLTEVGNVSSGTSTAGTASITSAPTVTSTNAVTSASSGSVGTTSKSSNVGGPQVTAVAGWVVGGVVAAAAMVGL